MFGRNARKKKAEERFRIEFENAERSFEIDFEIGCRKAWEKDLKEFTLESSYKIQNSTYTIEKTAKNPKFLKLDNETKSDAE